MANQKMHKAPAGGLLLVFAGGISLISAIASYFYCNSYTNYGIWSVGAGAVHVLQALAMMALGVQFINNAKATLGLILNALAGLLSIGFVIVLKSTPVAEDMLYRSNTGFIFYIVLLVAFVANAVFAGSKKEGQKLLNVLISSAVMLVSSFLFFFSEDVLGFEILHVAVYSLTALSLLLCAAHNATGKYVIASAPVAVKGYLRFVLVFAILGVGVTFIVLEKVGLAILMVIAAIVLAVISTMKDNAAKDLTSRKIAFYTECVDSGITEITGEKEIQKATLIAQKQKLKFTDVAALYAEAKELLEQDLLAKQEALLEQIKAAESKKYEKINRYADLRGKDKRIAMLTDERKDALETAKAIREGNTAFLNSIQQDEHDWATHGGVASAIAGPVAGLAVALDVQAKNAQIREQNKKNLRAAAPAMMERYKDESRFNKKAAELLEKIEEAKTKLTADVDVATCFDQLRFYDIKLTVSQTGTCTITTRIDQVPSIKIFEDVEAVLDGYITATIYNGDTVVDSCNMLIGKYGIGEYAWLQGMCLFCPVSPVDEKKLAVKFTPANMWAIEK